MAREFYNTVFSGHAGRDRGNTIKVMQNAIETDLVFNCFFEDDEEYIFAAGDIVSAFFFDIEDINTQFQSIGTFTPDIGTNQFTWDRDASDVGTPAAYSLAFKVVSGTAVPDFSIVVDYIVSGVPTGTIVPLPPGNVGVTPAEKAWLGVAVLNGDPALGFNHLGNVLMVDPSFGVGTVGFGITAFDDLDAAIVAADSFGFNKMLIYCNGNTSSSANHTLTSADVSIFFNAGGSLEGDITIQTARSLAIIGDVQGFFDEIDMEGTISLDGSAKLIGINANFNDVVLDGALSGIDTIGGGVIVRVLTATSVIQAVNSKMTITAEVAAIGRVFSDIFNSDILSLTSCTINPANHSNTQNGETFPAVVAQSGGTITNYGETVNVIGSIGGGTQDVDLTLGNVVSATVDTSTTTFTFSNPPASGTSGSFTIKLTNGGSQTVNWPASVDWGDAGEPTLTTIGRDTIVFDTLDGGTVWDGFTAGQGFT